MTKCGAVCNQDGGRGRETNGAIISTTSSPKILGLFLASKIV